MRRTGLGRRGGIEDLSGDPLDGLVNLFDIGLVLAVAFLIAGLGLATTELETPGPASKVEPGAPNSAQERRIPNPASAPSTSGRGRAVGKVYRLDDGSLIFVEGESR